MPRLTLPLILATQSTSESDLSAKQSSGAAMGRHNIQLARFNEAKPAHEPLHFLSLPKEIRQAVWRAISAKRNEKRDTKWFTKPVFDFAALQRTCRQLYYEIRAFRPQHFVPYKQFSSFTRFLTADYATNPAVRLKKYRSISLEFPLNADQKDFRVLTQVLFTCSPHLEELHLSFTGPDRYGTQTYLQGCAYALESGRQTKLPPDGQRMDEILPIQNVIMRMTKLRVLVMSNLNLQLFPAVWKHKAKLEYLHITADPRSAVHGNFDIRRLGILLIVPSEYFPPVKVMHLCANSMINAFVLPSVCALTLEHLTWTIPDCSLGSNTINAHWFSHTLQLINNLALNAAKLKTLRVCVAGAGLYGHVQQYTDLERALTSAVTRLRSLRDYEVHVFKKSTYFGHGILASLPPRLERFYTSDNLVSAREFHNFITEKYLFATIAPPQFQRPDPVEVRVARWDPEPPLAQPDRDCYPEYYDSDLDCEPIRMWINPTSYQPAFYDKDNSPVGIEILRKSGKRGPFALFLPGIIGEDHRRKDYIPLNNGNLKFVSYEFRNPEYKCRTGGVGETQTQMALRINGRLLDRERNKHLGLYSACEHITPRMSGEISVESQYQSNNGHINALIYSLNAIEIFEPRDREALLAELNASPFTDDDRYFGREDEAYRLFYNERTAKPENLPAITFPYFVDNNKDHQCHWMCPEADVPTLAQLDTIQAEEEASARRAEEKRLTKVVSAINLNA